MKWLDSKWERERERQNFREKRDDSRESERGLDARKRRGIYPIYMAFCSVHVIYVNSDDLCVPIMLNKFYYIMMIMKDKL